MLGIGFMRLPKRKPSGREKDEASLKLLDKLRDQLYSGDPSIRRQAAFHLSWLQDDGLEILQEALFGNCPARAKNAAAYGLRNMHGRMKKIAVEALEQGLVHFNGSTKDVCKRALLLLGMLTTQQRTIAPVQASVKRPKLEIKEIPRKTRPRRIIARSVQRPRKK
jgi:HEAT repeat protein